MTITRLKAGAIFGEIACIAKRTRTTTVVADGDCIALKIDTKNIDELKPAILTKLKDRFIEILVNRLKTMNEQATKYWGTTRCVPVRDMKSKEGI